VIEPHQLVYELTNKKSEYYKYKIKINFRDIQNPLLKVLKKMKLKEEHYEEYVSYMKSGAETKMNEIDEERNMLEARRMTNEGLYNKFVRNNL